ncbi:hypothetical protein L1F30_09480 [Simiduia sp. 21SJ11W-1]|uniref:hypothetical protein n=1 Tax=Simiduia sp. 21SJ11W-1 TaxID=2909669 RepID=UPI0020A1432D|nr:hypothetical protein [Simiduia sp. 21SJ11W-1]UTA46404.1 hypothetical protein L1F30_09480 [Simiduia sp. 21SJ11W-1]
MAFLAEFPPLTLGLMALIFVLSVYFVGPGYNSHSAGQSPAILTSTGIFGTFLGVALGLLEFDTENISASVPQLIDGLKTAFWTSIAGLLGALAVKMRHLFAVMGVRKKQETYHTATVTDLANLLTDIQQSLSDAGAGGLHSALARQHQEQLHAAEAIVSQLKAYQTEMAEANARALVVAIEKVMRDFNAEINAQYGDNFRELNAAVGKMLTWQENYKRELEALLSSQDANGKLLDKAAEAYRDMVQHAEVFKQVSASLGDLLAGTQSQSQNLSAQLEVLADVSERAAQGLPQLGERIDGLTDQLTRAVSENQRAVDAALAESLAQLTQTSERVHNQLAGLAQASDARVENHLAAIEQGLEQELVQALKTFGYQMTSLSEKFVNDYAPLTEKLRQLIHMADQVNQRDGKPQQRARALAE